jgi:hypothetical protein
MSAMLSVFSEENSILKNSTVTFHVILAGWLYASTWTVVCIHVVGAMIHWGTYTNRTLRTSGTQRLIAAGGRRLKQ